jgi:hypothetical protein
MVGILQWMSNRWLLKEDSATWSYYKAHHIAIVTRNGQINTCIVSIDIYSNKSTLTTNSFINPEERRGADSLSLASFICTSSKAADSHFT